jgi:hypothetical protein
MEKSAGAAPAGYNYQVNQASGLEDPFAAYRPNYGTPQYAQQQKRWGEIDNMWGDMAVSMIPGVGSVYLGNKAWNDFQRGQIGSGIGNLIWAGLGLVPGVGAVKGLMGAGKAVATAGKGAQTAGAMSRMWQGAKASLPAKAWVPATAAGIAAPMVMDPAQQQPQARHPSAPGFDNGNPLARNGNMPIHEYMARSMVANKPV